MYYLINQVSSVVIQFTFLSTHLYIYIYNVLQSCVYIYIYPSIKSRLDTIVIGLLHRRRLRLVSFFLRNFLGKMKENAGNPLRLTSLNHVSLLCRSMEESMNFYQNVLGFCPVRRPESLNFEGAWYTFLFIY